MTVFYTGRGDRGTSHLGKKVVGKHDPLFEVLGNLDELNCFLGVCRQEALQNKKTRAIAETLRNIQEILFNAQAEVAAIGMGIKSKIGVKQHNTDDMEKWIGDIDRKVPTLKNFVVPGASGLSARIDLARAVSRRVERSIVVYSKKKKISPTLLQFSNRLSSLLFALGRLANIELHKKEEKPSYR